MLLNRGDGSFGGKRDYPTGDASSRYPYSLAIGDLNGDGKPDIATVTHYTATVSVLLKQGRRQLPDQAGTIQPDAHPLSIAIGDLNGDGKPELATANSEANTVSVFANRGDGSFEAKTTTQPATISVLVAIGDLTPATGKPDLAGQTRRQGPPVLLNTHRLQCRGRDSNPARPRRGHLILNPPLLISAYLGGSEFFLLTRPIRRSDRLRNLGLSR